MKVQPVVKRDTLRLAVGMVAPVVLTVLGFWGAGRLDYTVVLGALLGYLVTVGNFFLLALTIQNNTEMAEREGEKNPLPPEPEQDPDDPENQKDVMERGGASRICPTRQAQQPIILYRARGADGDSFAGGSLASLLQRAGGPDSPAAAALCTDDFIRIQ